ncbi:MAG: hypothetical protein K6C69_07810 [Lachnospiraceae bacterium]|nr:hypothetical protein [Lachnospiraceae bacterium]
MIANIPTILSLIAGFIVCVVTFIYGYNDISWMFILILAMLVFFIIGKLLVKLFDKVLAEPELPADFMEGGEFPSMEDGSVGTMDSFNSMDFSENKNSEDPFAAFQNKNGE